VGRGCERGDGGKVVFLGEVEGAVAVFEGGFAREGVMGQGDIEVEVGEVDRVDLFVVNTRSSMISQLKIYR
jgi:hypothetical protein